MRKRKNSIWYSPVLFVIILIAYCGNTWSQADVKGQVTDASTGEPLPGVNVVIQGTTTGIVTDYEGNYTLSVPDENVPIVFSYVGYITETINLAGRTELDVTLAPDITALDEVVVIGYGTMKRSDLTGSVVSAKSDDLKTLKSSSVLESLQGKMPGVSIRSESGRTGSGLDISIRGERSLKAKNDPLFIVDGIPFGIDNENGIGIDLNPEEIESVEILKDAASTAIYGARGANGVIIITTKKGETGKAKVYANVYRGISQPTQKIPALDRDGYLKAAEDALRISLWKDGADWESTAGQSPDNFLEDYNEQQGYALGTNTDWQDLVLKNGMQADYLVGIRGGSEKVRYNTSLDYYNEEGVVLNDVFNRITFKMNVDAKINKRLSAGASSIISHRKREGIYVALGHAVGLIPLVSPYDSAGIEQYRPYKTKPRINPSVAAKRDKAELLTTRLFTTAYLNLNIIEGLDFRSTAGVDLQYVSDGLMEPPKAIQETQIRAEFKTIKDYNYTVSNVLSYSKDFGVFSANLMAGNEIQYGRELTLEFEGSGQPFENKLWYDLNGIENLFPSTKYEQTTLLSYFYRAGFNYNNIFLLNLSGRHDGASRLAPGHKWSWFPAASGAVRLSNLAFMSEVSAISDLKLRLSYGQSGNESVDPYLTSSLLSDVLYVEWGRPSIGTSPTDPDIPYNSASAVQAYRSSDNIPDSRMTWERTTEYNIGLDLGLIDNRIYAIIDAFKTVTDGFLLPVRVPLSSGSDNITKNIGKGETWGIEALVKTVIIDNRNINWTVNTTFSASKNKLIEIAEGRFEDRSQDWIVGQPYFDHEIEDDRDKWLIYKFDGIWQATAEDSALFNHYNATSSTTFAPGEIKVKDMNKDGIIGEADKVLYTDAPKWIGSIESSLSYKNLSLSFNIYARYGNTIQTDAYRLIPNMYDNTRDIDYWTPDNPTNEWPYVWSEADERGLQNEYIITFANGTFVKMKHITLSYQLPESLISKALLSSAEIYGSVKNPFMIYTDLLPGLDPERNGNIDFPLSRLFLIGINVEF